MTNLRYLAFLLAVLIALAAACGEAEPTPTPTPPATLTPAPTATPVPTPSPTSVPPTPTPESVALPVDVDLQKLLSDAMASLALADPFHFDVDATVSVSLAGFALDIPVTVVGDFQPPDRAQTKLSVSLGFAALETETITIGDTTYVKDPESGEWHIGESEVSLFADPLILVGGFLPDAESLTTVGVETLGTVVTVHLTGVSTGVAFGAADAEAKVDLWIGQEDGRVYKLVVEGSVPVAALGEDFAQAGGVGDLALKATATFSDYGVPVDIQPPEMAP